MHAIRQYEFGAAETLLYTEVDDPSPATGQVRIAVRAAGVHLLDAMIRSGESGGPFPLPELPMTPGREVAGVVDAVGPEVDEAWLGKRVVAHLGQASSGYAELAVANVVALQELPDTVTDAAAVAMIGTGRTTMGILDVAKLTADDVVLVPSAAGGIGSLLVQEARHLGATVIGLAGGPEKVARVRDLGADLAVDYLQDGWPELVRAELGEQGATVVLDGVGGATGRAAFDLLGTAGRIVLFGWTSGEATPFDANDLYAKGLTATAALGPAMLRRPGGIRSLEDASLAALASGRLTPIVDSTFPLAEAAKAHTALTARSTIGKVILIP